MPQAWAPSDGYVRKIIATAAALLVILATLVAIPVAVPGLSARANAQTVGANDECGIDVTFVLDRSGSIGSTNLATVKTGVTGILTQLSGTGSKAGIVWFNIDSQKSAATPAGLKDVDDVLASWPDAVTSTGWTNWYAGLSLGNTFAHTGNPPDALIFITDGNPNHDSNETEHPGDVPYFHGDDGPGHDATTAHTVGVISGNFDHVYGIGVGGFNDTQKGRLQSVVGAAGGTVLTGGFSDLGTILDDILDEICQPDLSIDKKTNDADHGAIVSVGGDVKWTYKVTNTGPVTVTGIKVTDSEFAATEIDCTGPDGGVGVLDHIGGFSLAPGEWADCIATGTAGNVFYTNTGTVTGDGNVQASDDSDYTPANPAIGIDKVTNSSDGPVIQEGDPVTWTYTVTNEGNVPLDNIVVTDDEEGTIAGPDSGDTNTDGVLDTTETWIYTATGTAGVGLYENTGTATGKYGSDTVTDSDDSSYTGTEAPRPGINIEKVTNDSDGPNIPVGDPVVWTYTVTNTGNVALTNVDVSDNKGVTPVYQSGDTNTDGVLDTTETWIYTAAGVAVKGDYENVGCVDANYNQEPVSQDCDSSDYFGTEIAIDIDKVTNGSDGPTLSVGEAVTWTYTVTNNSNVTLTDVSVTDSKGETPVYQSGDTGTVGEMSPGEVWVYEATGTATEGLYENIGYANAEFDGEPVPQAQDQSSYTGVVGALTIAKTVWNGSSFVETVFLPSNATFPTDVQWQIAVTNTTNWRVVDVILSDANAPACVAAFDTAMNDANGDNFIEPGRTITATCTGSVPSVPFSNVASVNGNDLAGAPVTPVQDDASVGQVLASAVIGDRVWYDLDDDGIQDAGEVGIPGSTVRITGLDGQDVDPVTAGVQTSMTMVTGTDGKYLFSGLPAGNYKVDTQLSWIPDPEAVGLRFTTASSFTIALADGGENLTADFGVVSDELPHTGLDADTLLVIAILLMIAGTSAVLVTRRRKDHGEDLAA